MGYWTQATALNLTILKKPLNLEVLGPIIKASDKVSPSDLLYMNKLLEFSTNTKLDASNATLEGKIVKHFGNRHRLNNLVEIEAVEKQTKEVQIVPSRAIGNSTMTRKNTTLNKVIRKQQRYGVISANLLHTNLAILHYTGTERLHKCLKIDFRCSVPRTLVRYYCHFS